ncbi:DUF4339 domain-containing protein [Fuerstiella marisgermanici]|uniref:GYF domain-containing protein n=1 Tax=Fuerstiella marisgermanici TaxID=1891926 RepID=A0A1P8WNF0_9PLAN|nr:DUF4339 domain-containing protein [Fuerstiella marisgermanici]APZ95580.1 hypothetical protein Fuma_05239 [Fuerstiella marisgermanici]
MNEDLCIDDFAIEDELKIDDFLIENDLGGQAMPRVDGPVYADTYFIRIEGTVSGPHALNEMGSLADSGRLTKRHQVRKGDTGRWLTIIDFPEIMEIMKASSSAVQQVLARSESHQRTAGQNGATTSQARATRTNASPKDEPGTQPSTSNDTAGSRPSSRPRSNIASAKPKQRGRKSAGRNSGSHKASKELRRLRAENARLRKQQAEDPDLQSIFDEVAQKSASATSARQTTPATTVAGAVTANMVTAQVPDRVTNASAASPLQGEPPQPQPHYQMTPQAATPRQPPVSPAFAARPPIPK